MGLEEYGEEIAAPKPLAAARKRLAKQERKRNQPLKPKRHKRRVVRQPKAKRLALTAPARSAMAAKRASKATETITLAMPHWVNGVAFGPGRVTVPVALVNVFLDNERRARQNDANMMGHKAAFIGPGGREMPVPYELFDSPNLPGVLEAMTIS
jgi:hypothetical protein